MAPWINLSGDGPAWTGPDPLNIGSQFGGDGDTGDSSDSGDLNGTENFGDGSNEWVPGIIETVNNPVDRLSRPYDTVAGVFDAAALNFDEGVGGLTSLIDAEPGNTAGPGQSPAFAFLPGVERQDGQPTNPGTTGSTVLDRIWQLILVGGILWLVVNVVAPGVGLLADLDSLGGDDES